MSRRRTQVGPGPRARPRFVLRISDQWPAAEGLVEVPPDAVTRPPDAGYGTV